MLIQYLPFLILAVVAVVFAGGAIALSKLIGPKHPNPKKLVSYESGMTPIGGTEGRFPVRYYLVAIVFILFDVEIIFLYPWAVVFMTSGALKVFLFAEMLVFLAVLTIGYIYIWKKGALNWD